MKSPVQTINCCTQPLFPKHNDVWLCESNSAWMYPHSWISTTLNCIPQSHEHAPWSHGHLINDGWNSSPCVDGVRDIIHMQVKKILKRIFIYRVHHRLVIPLSWSPFTIQIIINFFQPLNEFPFQPFNCCKMKDVKTKTLSRKKSFLFPQFEFQQSIDNYKLQSFAVYNEAQNDTKRQNGDIYIYTIHVDKSYIEK